MRLCRLNCMSVCIENRKIILYSQFQRTSLFAISYCFDVVSASLAVIKSININNSRWFYGFLTLLVS